MKSIAIVGGGISGLSAAHCLRDRFKVKVFEKERVPGGLIRCKRVSGSLFHLCGGHVFNTKNHAVADWFWSKFNRDSDFIRADRHSSVCLEDGSFVDYPIENHVYQLGEVVWSRFAQDVRQMIDKPPAAPANFDEFLLRRFGRTLYELYFKPYNEKVWRRNLKEVPLEWLSGKLPMPTPEEMLSANENHLEEKSFVHSTFYYARKDGSQFVADTLARDIDVAYDAAVTSMGRCGEKIAVRGDNFEEMFDRVIYCGNLKDLPSVLQSPEISGYIDAINSLESHGTTAVFCETDPIPYSWFYQPSPRHRSHRFICTGNFSPSNNALGKMTSTVEFTDEIGAEEIQQQLALMPFHPRYLTHHYSRYSYPIQHGRTREMVRSLREKLRGNGVYLVGRFAEWEYYNMDAAIGSAMETCKCIE